MSAGSALSDVGRASPLTSPTSDDTSSADDRDGPRRRPGPGAAGSGSVSDGCGRGRGCHECARHPGGSCLRAALRTFGTHFLSAYNIRAGVALVMRLVTVLRNR